MNGSALLRRHAIALLVALFLGTQVAALAHEVEHVFHQHETPCGLHVAAEHLVMVSPPDPAPVVATGPVTPVSSPSSVVTPERVVRSSAARAPPGLS